MGGSLYFIKIQEIKFQQEFMEKPRNTAKGAKNRLNVKGLGKISQKLSPPGRQGSSSIEEGQVRRAKKSSRKRRPEGFLNPSN